MSDTTSDDARRPLRVVGVSGSLHEPSRTTALVREILAEVAQGTDARVSLLEVATLGPAFAGALKRSELPPHVEAALVEIEQADLLVVASPVYRASFTGLFKHLFDFVGQYALTGTPVLLAATGGGERHALILEHQLRPLFAFFQALALPGGIYASDTDFTAYELTSPDIRARISQTVARALPIVERSASVVPSAYISTW
ncbi:FMN reductase [Microbacterium sp. RU33B]|uniref:FMN reductase n=1 Tax=Microbacterium sp. RU33B TaxID=1907390 RepID=UPI000963FADC|nr:FMN reductase [Microbacterium sp. RU33B]SIT87859.1 FMN reductase [Microbacterium sp. RU33B]